MSVQRLDRPQELEKVTVEYGSGGRIVTCFCGERVNRSIVPHFKTAHPTAWHDWTGTFVKLRGMGYPLKRIMRLFRAAACDVRCTGASSRWGGGRSYLPIHR